MSAAELLGARVRELRKERGLTQKALGELLGVTHVAVSYLESGTNGCTLDRLVRYAKALGVEPSELVTCLDEPKRRLLSGSGRPCCLAFGTTGVHSLPCQVARSRDRAKRMEAEGVTEEDIADTSYEKPGEL